VVRHSRPPPSVPEETLGLVSKVADVSVDLDVDVVFDGDGDVDGDLPL
jgi:hypothetical protein